MKLQTSKMLAGFAAAAVMIAATPAAATWSWTGGYKPTKPVKPPVPPAPPSTSTGGATPVLEPEMLVLFGLGAGGILLQRRRKQA
jgi:hypothetical protein